MQVNAISISQGVQAQYMRHLSQKAGLCNTQHDSLLLKNSNLQISLQMIITEEIIYSVNNYNWPLKLSMLSNSASSVSL